MTAALLDPQAAVRLAKLCGMLGSIHPGERANAALQAHKLVQSLGLTWRDVICVPNGPWTHHLPHDWQRMAKRVPRARARLWRRKSLSNVSMLWRGSRPPKNNLNGSQTSSRLRMTAT